MKTIALLTLFTALGLAACSKPKGPSPEEGTQSPAGSGSSAPAKPAETTDPSAAKEGDAAAVELKTVYFEFDSYSIPTEYRKELTAAVPSLKNQKSVRIQVEGHCDERGSNEYNLALGERRARAVMDFLVSEGVPAEILSTISYGEERPAVQGSTEEAWAKNRRAEFKKL